MIEMSEGQEIAAAIIIAIYLILFCIDKSRNSKKGDKDEAH